MTRPPASQAEEHQQNRMHKPFGRMNTLGAGRTRCRVSSCVQIFEFDANLRAPGCNSDQRPNHRSISQIRRPTTKPWCCAPLANYAPIDYAFGSVDTWAGRPPFEPA